MISKIKAGFVLAGIVLLGIWKVFTAGKKSGKAEIERVTSEAKADYENAGSEALIGGLENEIKVKNEIPDSASSHFR